MTKEKKTRKKTALKRLTITLCVVVMLFALAVPCFAWTSLPSNTPSTYAFAFQVQGTNTYSMYAFSHDGTVYGFAVDSRYFDYFASDPLANMVYVPVGTNAPTETQARNLVAYNINAVRSSSVASANEARLEQSYHDGYVDGYETAREVEGAQQYNLGYNNGYQDGYNDGEDANEVGKNMILTIFSVPSYVLSNVFNFEVFGINLYALITFLLTISIVAVVLRKIL